MKFALSARPTVEQLEDRAVPSVTVRLDYTYDTSGFFNDPARRVVMQRAADTIASKINDDLTPISPSGSNSWQASFFNPISNSTVVLDNPTINADEIVVFVAAGSLGGGNELGLTTTGGFSASGSRSWLDNLRSRGQFGTLNTPKSDFSTWGGMISFTSDVSWSFSSSTPAIDQYDFESVALHEMMHIFGFGLGEPAFTRHVQNGQFVGPTVMAVNGGPVGVVGNPPDHWAPNTRYNGQNSPMQASLRSGEKRNLSPLDFAALNDLGWEIYSVPAGTASPTQTQPVLSAATSTTMISNTQASGAVTSAAVRNPSVTPIAPVTGRFSVGSSGGVTSFGPNGEVLLTAFPFGTAYTAGIRVATGDITGDGVPDIFAGTGPGTIAEVRIIDGATARVIASINPFESSFTGGVHVAAGDFTGNGRADIVISADEMGGPVVAIYDSTSLMQGRIVELTRFLAINDPNFRGGARIAAGDLNGDRYTDLIVAAGYGGGPRLAGYDGRAITSTRTTLFNDFFAFEPELRNGTFVAMADLDGDGRADIIVGAGPGGAPRVVAFSGADLLANRQRLLTNFFAGNTSSRGGVRVSVADLDNNREPELIVGSGAGGTQVLAYQRGQLITGQASPTLIINANGDPTTGVYVG